MERKSLGELFSFDITSYASPVRYPSGTVIFPEWQKATQLLYLEEGKARCTMSHENGAVTILDFVEGPCFLGEMELLGVQKVTSGVTARTDCAGWMIRLEECREEMLNDPVFLRQLCIFSNEKAIRVTSTAACNQMYPLKNRLAPFLLQSQRQGLYCEPHTQTAAYLGVSYRHLLSVLSDFVKGGLLRKTPAGYAILRPEGLEALRIKDPFQL